MGREEADMNAQKTKERRRKVGGTTIRRKERRRANNTEEIWKQKEREQRGRK
jgi:hypothetical protein